jgi:hypothetical protein
MTHDHREEHVERHTVEYTFEAEEVSSAAGKCVDSSREIGRSCEVLVVS